MAPHVLDSSVDPMAWEFHLGPFCSDRFASRGCDLGNTLLTRFSLLLIIAFVRMASRDVCRFLQRSFHFVLLTLNRSVRSYQIRRGIQRVQSGGRRCVPTLRGVHVKDFSARRLRASRKPASGSRGRENQSAPLKSSKGSRGNPRLQSSFASKFSISKRCSILVYVNGDVISHCFFLSLCFTCYPFSLIKNRKFRVEFTEKYPTYA